MEWLVVAGTIAAVWITVVFNLVEGISDSIYRIVLPMPFVLVILFGVCSLCIIIYRVITFNDCTEAAEELKLQIKQAKKELSEKGMTFS